MSEYDFEARSLDEAVLCVIRDWHETGAEPSEAAFNELALRILRHQLRYNAPYARYSRARGVTLERMPESWEDIPAVPSDAFKEVSLATFDPTNAALAFETSGTTRGSGGRHYMERAGLYDAALLAGFDRFMLSDRARLRYYNLVPNPGDRPTSSLGYMMRRVSALRGDGQTGWYVRGEHLELDAFFADLRESAERAEAVCIATTAFALVAALDAAEARALRFNLAAGSRIMETGGFKGRTRTVSREELYARASRCFGIPQQWIVAEYGMTELTSQYYDDSTGSDGAGRLKTGPPWLRARALAPNGSGLPDGVAGALAHVDLANRSSCVAIQTEDVGARFGRRIALFGREPGSVERGCSLDAETLAVRG